MKKSCKIAGVAACLVAILVMVGGHWLALQSVAWGTMLLKYARQDSLLTAFTKTFDGRHPCSLCLRVREGVQQDAQQQTKVPWSKTETLSESLWEFRTASLPPAPILSPEQHAVVPLLHSDFTESPPTPPPRG